MPGTSPLPAAWLAAATDPTSTAASYQENENGLKYNNWRLNVVETLITQKNPQCTVQTWRQLELDVLGGDAQTKSWL